MRIWDFPVSKLCRKHLLGEHRELHCIFTVIWKGRKGYSRHPETLRWVGKLPALKRRHAAQVAEMARRGYRHASDLPAVRGLAFQRAKWESLAVQKRKLRAKGCDCKV